MSFSFPASSSNGNGLVLCCITVLIGIGATIGICYGVKLGWFNFDAEVKEKIIIEDVQDGTEETIDLDKDVYDEDKMVKIRR